MRLWRLLVRLCLLASALLPLIFVYHLIYTDSVTSDSDDLRWFSGAECRNCTTSNIQPVLLLTYQRSGSSFLGQLFNNNPSVMYWFEPGDGIYGDIYGTAAGWVIRDDVTNYRDGTMREQPHQEITQVANHLHNMFRCDVQRFPVSVLTHVFLKHFHHEQRRLIPYIRCSINKTKDLPRKPCRTSLARVCPGRFGHYPKMSEQCRTVLNAPAYRMMSTSFSRYVDEYNSCIDRTTTALSPCLPHITNLCHNSTMVVLKTVRISMAVVADLLHRIPHLKVIHYMRDPRPTTLSRLKHHSFRGLYAEKYVNKTAEIYCRDALSDIKIRNQLQRNYPKAFYSTYFEHLATDPERTAREIYAFLGQPMVPEVLVWLRNNTQRTGTHGDRTARDSRTIINKWKANMTAANVQEINRLCGNLFTAVDIDWLNF